MIVYFEGIDGAGKSTQIERLKAEFSENSKSEFSKSEFSKSEFSKNTGAEFSEIITTKEPGGTELGIKIRDIILKGSLSPKAELLLFLADRAEHYAKVIKPNKNKIILSDRGFVSGLAYAMANAQFDVSELAQLNRFALDDDFSGKFVFLKVSKELLRKRLLSRASSDSIEKRGEQYLMRVQECMEIILKDLELDYIEINADDEIGAISDKIMKFIKGAK